MSDYISRSALLKKMFPYEGIDKKTYSINAKAVEVAIVDALVADVVEVVRCKDCKYSIVHTCPITGTKTMFCDYWWDRTIAIEPMQFCCHGERR